MYLLKPYKSSHKYHVRKLMQIMSLAVVIFTVSKNVHGQDSRTITTNPDSLFFIAQKHAANNELNTCREICYPVLKDFPSYHDFRILAGRTLAWENNFDSAKIIIEPILDNDPYNKEALLALADVEIWQKKYENALAYVDTGLIDKPSDTLLISKRNDILQLMSLQASQKTISYGTLYPDTNSVGLTYYFDFFKKPYIARRHMFSLQYIRVTKFAPVSGRFNIGDNILDNEALFENPSYQIDVDAYPKINDNSYLYLNYGIGKGSFFPLHKFGVEYFQGLNNSFEFSIGNRYMYWESSIYFLTGSISKYLGAYWLSFRPFISVADKNFSDSYLIEARRYFGIFNSYLSGLIIFGDSPDQPLSLAEEFGNFRSIKYVVGIQHRISQWQFNASIGLQREEFFEKEYRTRTEYRIGINYVF